MSDIDPITLNIVGKGLQAIAREMAANMRRHPVHPSSARLVTSRSASRHQKGSVVAQAEMIPMQTGGISEAFKPVRERFDFESLTEDDAFLMNDPFTGGQHLQDIFLFTPVFIERELLGFAASVAHHVEVGGGMPGLNATATEFYQEGLRFPASRFSRSRDWDGGFVETFIRANVRVPEKVIGDLNAQFSANNTADRRLNELVDRYGIDTVRDTMSGLQDYAERRIRDGIRKIPNGIYSGEDFVEASAWGLDPVPIRARVEVQDDRISVDFAGTGSQVPANINCPYASTISAVQGAIRGVLHDEDIPFNEGCNRPITVRIPYGSILNPRPPAAVRARMSPACRVHNAIIRALSDAVPDRIISPGFDTTTAISLSHLNPETGEYGVVIEILGGGWGAGPEFNGMHGLDNPLSNCANAPVEALESEYGYFRVDSYELEPATAGSGTHDGGYGVYRSYAATRDDVVISAYSDRFDRGVAGILGGGSGAPGSFIVERADGTVEHLPSTTSITLKKGDVFAAHTGGGGGYGEV
ncbi:MAG: hydantoinase B/oxoprolinase family protein [Thermomicrobiales bacterium]